MEKNKSNRKSLVPSGVWCITSVVVLFGYLGMVMGVPNMLNTIMRTAHDLLLNGVLLDEHMRDNGCYRQGVCRVWSGSIA